MVGSEIGNNINMSDMAQRPARGRGRGRRGRGSRGTQRSVQPGFLDDNSSDDDSRFITIVETHNIENQCRIQEENMPRSSGRGRGMARERIQALVDDTGLQEILGETGDTQDIENNIDDSRYSRTLTSCYLCNLYNDEGFKK